MELKDQQNRKGHQIQTSILSRSKNRIRKYLSIRNQNHHCRKSNQGFIELETLIWLSSLTLITFSTIKLNQHINEKNQKHIEEFNREWK